ncbi:MAG: M15 family metallopeptidase [Planctomycetes bacterium]|nr:M15 family metallopeptidase [Planctomycetota bacterium]
MGIKTLKIVCLGLLGTGVLFVAGCGGSNINVARLSDADRAVVEQVVKKLEPMIAQRRSQGDIAALSFEELYLPLNGEERAFLRQFQNLDTRLLNITIPYQGIPSKTPDLVVIKGQMMKLAENKTQEIPPQFLPRDVYNAYMAMTAAMKKDIGRMLYVESGYRSAAYQLYLFVFYLKNHDYSIRETARFAAWPGYSEHGQPIHQAVDFVNERGIDGQNDPAAFEALEEYQWMLRHAERYGFKLSYPHGSKMAFEPWHWHYSSVSQ